MLEKQEDAKRALEAKTLYIRISTINNPHTYILERTTT